MHVPASRMLIDCPGRVLTRAVVIVGLAFLLGACGGSDGAGTPLSLSEYSLQGNAICIQMQADLDALERQATPDLSSEEQRTLAFRASDVSRDGIDALFDLPPPESFIEQRLLLLDLAEQRRNLISRMANGENLNDQVAEVQRLFEEEAATIWPSCTNP